MYRLSDLKHLSVDALGAEIHRITAYRASLSHQAAINDEAGRQLLEQAAVLKKIKSHNAGQREAWARIYLAQKT